MFVLGRNYFISARSNITYAAFSLCRGVNISVLRHEAEFYGITPLGTFLCRVLGGNGRSSFVQLCPLRCIMETSKRGGGFNRFNSCSTSKVLFVKVRSCKGAMALKSRWSKLCTLSSMYFNFVLLPVCNFPTLSVCLNRKKKLCDTDHLRLNNTEHNTK